MCHGRVPHSMREVLPVIEPAPDRVTGTNFRFARTDASLGEFPKNRTDAILGEFRDRSDLVVWPLPPDRWVRAGVPWPAPASLGELVPSLGPGLEARPSKAPRAPHGERKALPKGCASR